MRLKHGAFRHLRMAAKGAALGIRHLLKKVDENFGLRRRRARGRRRCRKNKPKGRVQWARRRRCRSSRARVARPSNR